MGYFALCPNPRGSYGQGEAFTQGNVKDFGGGDYRDIMSGVDEMVKPARVHLHPDMNLETALSSRTKRLNGAGP